MKLRNKLLPLTGIAAIAATVTPLGLTSCSSKMEMHDLSKGFVPSTKASVAGYLGQHDATKTYIEDVKVNPDIFVQDYLYGLTKNFANYDDGGYSRTEDPYLIYEHAIHTTNSLKAGCTTPSFGMVNISYPGEPDVQYPTISLSVSVEVETNFEIFYSRINKNTGEALQRQYENSTTKRTINVKYENIPFYAVASGYNTEGLANTWKVTAPTGTTNAYIWQYLMEPWSINYSIDQQVDTKQVNLITFETDDSTTNSAESDTLSTYKQMLNLDDVISNLINFGFSSYYLSNIKQLPELNSVSGYHYNYVDLEIEGSGEEPAASTEATTANVWGLYMPLELYTLFRDAGGTITLYGSVTDDLKTASGNIELEQIDVEEDDIAQKLKLDAGTAPSMDTSYSNFAIGTNDFTFEEVEDAQGTKHTGKTAGQYYYRLPSYIVAHFTYPIGSETLEWNQKVYLNQNTLEVTINEYQ